MSGPPRPLLEVGRIVRAHGLRGQVVVDLWTQRRERLAPGATLDTERGPLVVVSASPHQDRFLVTFDAIGSREDADAWRGVVLLAAPLEREESPDEVIWIDDLFGATVVDAAGVHRGIVTSVESNPASDLLVLDTGALVPLTFVTRVRAHELVEVDVPEGLFE